MMTLKSNFYSVTPEEGCVTTKSSNMPKTVS